MKKLQQLRAKKGFTLVECMVAIAIFAMMSLIVMQILTIAIQRYARNDRVEKDLDIQLEKLVKANGTVERSTFDLTLEFLKPDASSAGSMTVSNIGVYGSDDENSERLELNSLKYDEFDVAETNPNPTPDADDDEGGLGVVKNYMHIYGSKGIGSVYVSETSDTVANGIHTIKLDFQVNDPDKVLDAAYINSIKIALPASSNSYRLSNISPTPLKSLFLGNTVRMYDFGTNDGSTYYTFSVEFRLADADYAEYGSFAKYFIDTESTSTEKSATFVENVNVLGVYNIKQGTPQTET